jgi:hypothetical protein
VLVLRTGVNAKVVLAVAALLLVPGLLQRVLYRDLHAARRALDGGRPAEAMERLVRFRRRLVEQPWLDAALWLRWPDYTTSVHALAGHELGRACLAHGEPGNAERAWREALHFDPAYPHPYAHLGLLAAARGDPFAADSLLVQAWLRGYPAACLAAARAQVKGLVEQHDARQRQAREAALAGPGP